MMLSIRTLMLQHVRSTVPLCAVSSSTTKSHLDTKRYCSGKTNGDDGMKTVVKAWEKFFKLPEGYKGKISRHHFHQYGKDIDNAFGTIEGLFVNAVLMKFSDLYGLDKFPEDGGKEVTLEELYGILKTIPKETVEVYVKAGHRASFRGIDTNNNGVICRDEWSTYLKKINSYESDEQARQSFDSLDTNGDGVITMAEFEASSSDFWTSTGSSDKSKDFYGTSASK